MHVVTIGGGTGQFHVLQALRVLRRRVSVPITVTAIPTTSDSAGSSGLLRRQGSVIAPGDISQCLFGLHPEPELVEPLFTHRLKNGSLKGHTPRNVIVLSYLERFGATQEAMDKLRDVFHLEGDIMPATFSSTHVHALLNDGTHLESEDDIYNADLLAHGGVQKLWLEPAPEPNPSALAAIARADVIIVCPGTLACSVMPNFLVPGMPDALRASRATKVYITNLMNRRGHQPEDWSVLDYVEYLEQYLGAEFFDVVICNTQALSLEQETRYDAEKIAVPLVTDLRASGRNLIALPLLQRQRVQADPHDVIGHLRALVRHDPERVAGALLAALGGRFELNASGAVPAFA